MHILYIGWAHHVHVRRWAAYFAGRGHRVTILTNSNTFEPLENVIIFRILSRSFFSRFAVDEIRAWVFLLRPDVIHVQWATYGPKVRKVRDIPIGVTAWGSDIYMFSSYDKTIQASTKEALSNADFITCDSQDLKKRILEIIGKGDDKVIVIQWGVDTKVFRPLPVNDLVRSRFGLPMGNSVILSMRNINPIYNPETIIEAFGILVRRIDNVVLVQKYYKSTNKRLKELQELVEKKGLTKKVFWIGELEYEDLPWLYNTANVVVSVPSSDGTPMTLLEAMACGVTPIVSELPSVLEWVKHDENAIVVPAGDAIKLAQALEKILIENEKRQQISKINIKVVKDRAEHSTHMNAMEELYCSVIKKNINKKNSQLFG
jgi:glycosyltransferase involved in cell wall biosynthesis